MSTRLSTIATRQQSSRIRDAIFVALITIVAAVSVTSVGTAVQVANVKIAAR